MPLAPALEPSAFMHAPPHGRSRAPLVWAAAGVVAALAIPLLATRGDGDDPAAAPSAATPPRAAIEATPATSAQVELVIESVPTGADVLRVPDGQRLGRTPYRIRRPPADGYVQFELRREGHESETISLRADVGVETQVVLRRLEPPADTSAAAPPAATRKSGTRSSRGGSRSHKPAPKPAPTIDDGALDPFSSR